MINVTKSYLPDLNEYISFLEKIWISGQLTNQGPLVTELEDNLKKYLGVSHFSYLTNGTLALQIAIKALDLKGEVITTPFSYVATTSSLIWEHLEPVFVDIDPQMLTIDVSKIKDCITEKTTAILATHVYGIPCLVDEINLIANEYNLKVIYDAAHSFSVRHKGKSILDFGDISTLSFHATKLFHTVEGGGIATSNQEILHRVSYLRNFGHNGQEDFWGVGINGKNSEFHAAMGLSILPKIDMLIEYRKRLSLQYDNNLITNSEGRIKRPIIPDETEYNYSYYPIIFDSERSLLNAKKMLNAEHIYPRRYFYPPLHHLPYITPGIRLPVCEAISSSVLCLPLFYGLEDFLVDKISKIILKSLKAS